MKNILLGFIICLLGAACSKRAQCPAYMDFSKGTLSVQDKSGATPDEIREQSQKLLQTQPSYIQVKRNKRTGLVETSRKVKKKKNNALTDKGFNVDPRTLKGLGQ